MSEKAAWMQRGRLSRRALMRAGAKVGMGAAGLVLVGCGSEDAGGGSARQVTEVPAAPAESELTVPEDASTQSHKVPSAMVEDEDGQAIASIHPAIAHRAGIPVDRTTIGFPDAQVEILDFSDFQ